MPRPDTHPVKLTLKLDSGLIEGAKEYAQAHGTSLSRLVASFFGSLISAGDDRAWTAGLSRLTRSYLDRAPCGEDAERTWLTHLDEKYGGPSS